MLLHGCTHSAVFCTLNGRRPSVTTHTCRSGCVRLKRPTARGVINGSGPNVTTVLGATRVVGVSQSCGNPGGGNPSNTNLCEWPSELVCETACDLARQTTGMPLARACARPVSRRVASRWASRSRALSALSRSDHHQLQQGEATGWGPSLLTASCQCPHCCPHHQLVRQRQSSAHPPHL